MDIEVQVKETTKKMTELTPKMHNHAAIERSLSTAKKARCPRTPVIFVSSDSSDDDDDICITLAMRDTIRNGSVSKNIFPPRNDSSKCKSAERNESNLQKLDVAIKGRLIISDYRPETGPEGCEMSKTPCSGICTKLKCVELSSSSDDDKHTDGTKSSNMKLKSGEHSQRETFLKSLSPDVPETRANTDAFRFRCNFEKLKVELTSVLFSLYNVKIFTNNLPADMNIKWKDNLMSTAGYCKYLKSQKVKTCNISLSTSVLSTADRLRDTLLHEMCHAAVWIISKRERERHGPLWKTWALRCAIVFPEVKVPERCHSYKINYKHTYMCLSCSHSYGRNCKSLDLSRHRCGKCRGVLHLL